MPATPTREMMDIHIHLIPAVDDGAEDVRMALRMLLTLKQEMVV